MAIIRYNPVLRETAHVLVPLILLYALYVQFHGDFGPGGGFQAGIIFAVGVIVYALIYGRGRLKRILSRRTAERLACLGVLLYVGTGLAAMAMGGAFLDYDVLAREPLAGQHIGILLVELGVGVTIVGVVVTVFHLFIERWETGSPLFPRRRSRPPLRGAGSGRNSAEQPRHKRTSQ